MINLIFFISFSVFAQDLNFNSFFCEEIKKPFFKTVEENGVKYVLPNRSYSRDFKFPINKDKSRKRIFIIGESAAAILYSNKDRPKGQPFNSQKDFEIIDFGMPAYDSGRIRDVFFQSLDFNPDAIVLLSGNNEAFNEPCPGIKAELNRRYLNLFYNISRIFSDEREKLFNYSLEIQKKNISDMAEAAQKHGIKFFITTLPSNLFLPPNGERPYFPAYIKGYSFFDNGEYEKSFSVFNEIISTKKYKNEPFANYYAGLCLFKLSRNIEALEFLSRAAAYDYRMDRASKYRNEALKNLAHNKGAFIADLEGFFRGLSSSPLIKEEFFSDGVHWYKKYNFLVQNFFLGILYKNFNLKKGDISVGYDLTKEEPEISFYYAFSSFAGQSDLENKINERTLYFISKIMKISGKYEKNIKIAQKNLREKKLYGIKKESLLSSLKTYFAEFYRRNGEEKRAVDILNSIPEADRGMLWKKIHFLCAVDLKEKKEIEKNVREDSDKKGFFASYSGLVSVESFYNEEESEEKREEESLEKIIKGDPQKNSKAKKYSDAGVEKLKKNDIKSAVDDFSKALEINPYHAESLLNMAYAKRMQKKFQESLNYYSVITHNANFYKKEIVCSAYLGKAGIHSENRENNIEKEELKKALKFCSHESIKWLKDKLQTMENKSK